MNLFRFRGTDGARFVYGRILSRLSTGSSFGDWTLLRSDAGGIGDVFLFGVWMRMGMTI
jgi:hypothetical protein